MKIKFNGVFKAICFVVLNLVFTARAIAQNVPNVIPPSPEASSIVSYGNTGVNFYTGSPSFSIPIANASANGLTMPVSLSYTGFGGIKVEEIAPWVGLGWSLNAGGVVSRTVRGLADDKVNGYINAPTIPNLTSSNTQVYIDYNNGITDSEPDEFNFNVNGLSGTFHISKSQEVIQKVNSNLRIVPFFSSYAIYKFEITDTQGYVYVFSTEEENKSFSTSQSPTGYSYETSSWYLSSVKDQSGATLMTIDYHSINEPKNVVYYPQNELSTGVFFGGQYMKKSWNYTKAKRISKITHKKGSINFIASTATRKDYLDDKWLDRIEIRDINNALIKKFTFHYTYLTSSGSVATGTSTSGTSTTLDGIQVGAHQWRLKLDEVKEWDSGGTTANPPYVFTYNTNYYLPSRYSFAQDHWGYYNGKTSNTSLEPTNKVKYYTASSISYASFGTADREPSEAHSQAGILTKVTYPTGGHTSYNYEQHAALAPGLKNNYSIQSMNVTANNTFNNITISLINDPFESLRVTGTAAGTCDIAVEIYNSSGTSYVTGTTLNYTGAGPVTHAMKMIDIEPGTYKIRARKFGCSYVSGDYINVSWENETYVANKAVGGVRVASITDHDGIDASNDVTREYYYNENGDSGSSNSTGRVVSTPKYGVQLVFNIASTPPAQMIGSGYMRTVQSAYPMMNTQGAEVGYKKVTVRTVGSDNIGKTEYYFSTSDDYIDFYDGYYYTPLIGEGLFNLGSAGVNETYPFPRVDSRDNARGLLTQQIDYRWTGSTYHKVKQTINTYAWTFDPPMDNGGQMVNPGGYSIAANSTYKYVDGLVYRPGQYNHFKRYRIYAGRIDLEQSITRHYNLGSGTVYYQTQNTNYFDDLASEKFQISRTQMIDSENIIHESRTYYSYDATSLSGLTGTETTALNTMSNSKNMIAKVVQQEQYRNGVKLSTTRTNFNSFSGRYLPQSVETAKGTSALETRLTFHSYDGNGNITAVSKDGGAQQRYIYGYDSQMPTAQVIGATNNNDIAYTSFEQSGKGNWSYTGAPLSSTTSPSGSKYYSLTSGNVIKYNLTSSKKYKVTYFAKNGVPSVSGVVSSNDSPVTTGTGWKYYEKTVSGVSSMTISGSAHIDELRIYPVDAQMVSFTYDTRYGVSSKVDMNQVILKYEYDGFGRLSTVKDQNGNIVSGSEYEYQATSSTSN